MPNVELLWNVPPPSWPLNKSDVHIWAAPLDRPAEKIPSFKQSLSPDELSRAEKFNFDRDRYRFIIGRSLLRSILGSYLEIEPSQLRFTYAPRGKPSLAGIPGQAPLYFSVAHSENLILIAVTPACPLGVDVEWVHPVNDAVNIAEQFFSIREVAGFKALPPDQRQPAFLNIWTRKEACLKARGDGISEMVKEIEVSFVPDAPPQVVAISGNQQSTANWTLLHLAPATEFVGAVAIGAKDLRFSCWQWPA